MQRQLAWLWRRGTRMTAGAAAQNYRQAVRMVVRSPPRTGNFSRSITRMGELIGQQFIIDFVRVGTTPADYGERAARRLHRADQTFTTGVTACIRGLATTRARILRPPG